MSGDDGDVDDVMMGLVEGMGMVGMVINGDDMMAVVIRVVVLMVATLVSPYSVLDTCTLGSNPTAGRVG